MNLQNVEKQWEFMHNNQNALKKLSRITRQSWEKSKTYNLDYMNALPEPIFSRDFERIKLISKRFFVYASSIINPLIDQTSDKEIGLMLFDKEGCLLRLYGREPFLSWANNNNIKIATKWSESVIGTNIFSIGINSENGTILKGAENFSRFLINGDYYFAPIKLDDGDVYGGIALAVPTGRQSDNLLALAVSIARAIVLQFFWFTSLGIYCDITEGTGMLCIDQSNGCNRILMISNETMKILGIPIQHYYYDQLENIIDSLPQNKSFWDILNKNIKVLDKTIQITVSGKPVIVSISTSSFKEKKFHMNGIIVSMNSISRINKLVSKYSGNAARYNFDDVIAQSGIMLEVMKRCKTAALIDSNILILGESGVGKDVIAQAIHNESKRSKKPFVAINCASFSKELIASELFGYESGAFTGAKKEGAMGKFELANNGTFFLDEIGDMPLDIQAVLLRVLEEKCFSKVGGNTIIHSDVRIITATNKNLTDRVKQGLFREDLFYRLGVIRIQIPPLRSRENDILLLTEHFITQICARLGKPKVQLSKDALAYIMEYSWPGNVRELQNLLEGIISTCDAKLINEKEIQHYMGEYSDDILVSVPDKGSIEASVLDEFDERIEYQRALKICRKNKTKAAAYLGISRSTFYRRLHELGMK